jgi:alkaline phosphatase D
MKFQTLFSFSLLFVVLLASCKKEEVTIDSDSVQVIAFGSCNRQDAPQPLWDPIVSENPDLWIWMGDNIYGDSPVMDTLRAKYSRQNANPGYQKLKASTPIIGIWDDHDYGINDGGKYYAQKRESRDLMFDFLDVSADAPERAREGAYSSHIFGSGENLVKVILLDARYFRDTLDRVDRVYQTNEDGEVLGADQWDWLAKELKESQAKVNLIVSGIQFLPTEHAFEKWANFPNERERLLNLIASSGAKTPILLSGDRHIAEIMKLEDSRFPRGIFEITASGLTHTWGTVTEEPNQFRINDLIAKLNYGVARFDWKNNRVTFQIKGEEGVVYATQSIEIQ